MRHVIRFGADVPPYTRLTPLRFVTVDGAVFVECRCTCGNTSHVRACDLGSGKRKSCGCLRDEIVGTRFRPRVVPPSDQRSTLSPDAQRTESARLDAEFAAVLAARLT